jgi:hypothetical protein
MNDILAPKGTISEMIGTLKHLRAEITRLTAERDALVFDRDGYVQFLTDDNNKLRAVVDNLKRMVIAQEKLLRSKDAENERLTAQVDTAAEMLREVKARNADISAWQCVYTDGKTGLVVGEYGNQYCAMAKEVEALRAEVAWHVEDKNKWEDTQAAHLREVTRLTARVEVLEKSLGFADVTISRLNGGEALQALMSLNNTLTARVEELEGALTPFAEALKGNWSHQHDLTMVRAGLNSSDLRMNLTLGNFRRARAALSASQPAPSALPVLSDEFVRAEMDAMQARENKRLETLFTQPAPPSHRRREMSEMTNADFVEHMHDLHLKCVAPSFDDGNRLMTIARRCVDATEVTARLIAERDALTAELTRLKAVEADYDYHEREMIELEEDNARLTARVAKLEWACSATQHDIQQTLGKALNYPWYKDDQKNFPNATEADGVCVGDHVAESLADETVTKITALRAEVEKLNKSRNKWGQKYNTLLEQHKVTVSQLKAAVWSDSEECKLLTVENEKLRKELDEAQREITQLYEDAAGESI